MKREQFEHTIRAAGAILGVTKVLVIGSQAIHASCNDVIQEAQRSIETDIADLEDRGKSASSPIAHPPPTASRHCVWNPMICGFPRPLPTAIRILNFVMRY